METFGPPFEVAEVPPPGIWHGQEFSTIGPAWQELLNLALGNVTTELYQGHPWNVFECAAIDASENYDNVVSAIQVAAPTVRLPQNHEGVQGPNIDFASKAESTHEVPITQAPGPDQHRFIQVGVFMETPDLQIYIIKIKAEDNTYYSCAYPTCSHRGHFDARRQVIAHIRRVHFDERPFKCLACERRFRNRQDAKRHVDTRNKGKIYRCTLCNKGYTRNYSRNKHQRHCFMKKMRNED